MATRTVPGRGATAAVLRKDAWWLSPLVTAVVLGAFVVYATWVAFVGRDYYADPYLSPFYSPCLASSCQPEPSVQVVGDWWKLSPALLVLPFPLFFRVTCYYYRKAYYRAFWFSPRACAIPDVRARYTGETRFPLILQNLHRYSFYLALPFPVILAWDAIQAFRFPDGFGMGLGTLVLITNVVLLSLYTLSCHSCRHLCGGHVNVFSKAPVRARLWRITTVLNQRHALYAWISLVGVALADLYVRLVATGTITDLRFF